MRASSVTELEMALEFTDRVACDRSCARGMELLPYLNHAMTFYLFLHVTLFSLSTRQSDACVLFATLLSI